MRGYTLIRLVASIAGALIVVGLIYLTHPDWFRDRSIYTLPVVGQSTPTAGPTAVVARPTPKPTATVPSIDMTLHLDDIWITPLWVDHSQGGNGVVPNAGDEFLVVNLSIVNRSQVDYQVRDNAFQVLDSHKVLDPPLSTDFTRRHLREVKLIPGGYIRGTLIFEVPLHEPAAYLIYQPDPLLDPSKQKIWVLR
ncbi:MAG TPA: DUF4352 domain-containing protein [Chloroflexota bacterium]|nr:DUF4352 domain-containing protein [Chloroflexota bacterium]